MSVAPPPSNRQVRLTPCAPTRPACHRPHPLAAAVLLGLLATPAAQAARIVVAHPGDTDVAATNTCTLRQAIVSMNDSALSGNCHNTGAAFGTGDTIQFAPDVDTITLADTPRNSIVVTADDLTIDAGTDRTVTVERTAGGTYDFSVIKALGAQPAGDEIVPIRLTLIGLTIQNGYGDGDFHPKYLVGGGVAANWTHLTLERCLVRNNRAAVGGGVFMTGRASLTLRSTRISNNIADEYGGGVGAITTMLIEDSTIDGNFAENGGGIVSTRGPITLLNSTVSGNTALGSGSAIAQINAYDQLGPIAILNSTIACNNAQAGAAIQAVANPGVGINVFSSILANTTHAGCTTVTGTEIAVSDGSITVGGDRNLVRSSSAIDASAPFATTPLFGDPQLGPLQDNGGPTPTRALQQGSPAIEAGSNPGGLAHDQRGAPNSRTIGFGPDIGAFEHTYVGLCGTAHGRSFVNVTPTTPGLCATGAFLQESQIFGSGPWSWFCASVNNPVNNEFCRASMLVHVNLAVTNPSGSPISTFVYGEPVRLSATVSGSASVPTGTVSIFDASFSTPTPLCTDLALVSGATSASASCDVSGNRPEAGSRLLKAVYNGNATYGSATSSDTPITVQRATSTTLSPLTQPQPSTVGLPFMALTYVQIALPSLATASGTLTVQDLTDGVSCSYDFPTAEPGCELTPTSVGTHDLLVSWPGDGNMMPSSATTTHIVQIAATTLSVEPPPPIAFGESVLVTASVAGTTAPGTPTGTVSISVDGVTCSFDLATATQCALTPPTHGTREIHAWYSGDARFAASNGSSSVEVVPHSIGGALGGLLPGNTLMLQLAWNSASEQLALAGDGGYAFSSSLSAGTPYAVSVIVQPSNPQQTCSVVNGSGTMGVTDIDDIVVQCSDAIFVDGFDL